MNGSGAQVVGGVVGQFDLGRIHHAGVAPVDRLVGLIVLVSELKRGVAQREAVADDLATQTSSTSACNRVFETPLPAVTRWESIPGHPRDTSTGAGEHHGEGIVNGDCPDRHGAQKFFSFGIEGTAAFFATGVWYPSSPSRRR